MIHNTLFLASQSISRRLLLEQADISYKTIQQDADEYSCDWTVLPKELVTHLALLKMQHAQLPSGQESDICFVLTADTVGYDSNNTIYGKAQDKAEAIKNLKLLAHGFVATGFCLEKKEYKQGSWHTILQITEVVESAYVFEVPDNDIETYFSKTGALETAGSIAIEGYGLQFLKSVQGSYTGIIGLPLFELRQALEKLGFF